MRPFDALIRFGRRFVPGTPMREAAPVDPGRRDLAALLLAGGAGGALLGRPAAAALAAPGGLAALTAPERETLLRGIAELDGINEPTLSAQAAALLAMMARDMPEAPALRDLHRLYRGRGGPGPVRRPEPSIDMGALAEAVALSRPLAIRYTDLRGEVTRREIEPLALVYPDHGVFVLAWCRMRQGYRQFFAHAIDAMQVLPGSFADRRQARLEAFLAEQVGRRG